MKTFFSELRTSIMLTIVLTVLACGIYPLAVWGAGQALFHDKANGSLITDKTGAIRGSKLLAQNFSSAKYFQPRPSAAGNGYDATSSSGTNLGPTSAKLLNGIHATDTKGQPVNDPNNFDGIKDLVQAYRTANNLGPNDSVPADAVTRSASGLDPHISLENARLQTSRVAKARNLTVPQIETLIASSTDGRAFGIFGDAGVNVLMLNIALDQLAPVN